MLARKVFCEIMTLLSSDRLSEGVEARPPNPAPSGTSERQSLQFLEYSGHGGPKENYLRNSSMNGWSISSRRSLLSPRTQRY